MNFGVIEGFGERKRRMLVAGFLQVQVSKSKRRNWSHRESNTGRSRILAGLMESDEPQATVIPLHYRTDAKLSVLENIYLGRPREPTVPTCKDFDPSKISASSKTRGVE
jgi:hypothetical protein